MKKNKSILITNYLSSSEVNSLLSEDPDNPLAKKWKPSNSLKFNFNLITFLYEIPRSYNVSRTGNETFVKNCLFAWFPFLLRTFYDLSI